MNPHLLPYLGVTDLFVYIIESSELERLMICSFILDPSCPITQFRILKWTMMWLWWGLDIFWHQPSWHQWGFSQDCISALWSFQPPPSTTDLFSSECLCVSESPFSVGGLSSSLSICTLWLRRIYVQFSCWVCSTREAWHPPVCLWDIWAPFSLLHFEFFLARLLIRWACRGHALILTLPVFSLSRVVFCDRFMFAVLLGLSLLLIYSCPCVAGTIILSVCCR